VSGASRFSGLLSNLRPEQRELAQKIVRFAMVGGLSSLLYLVFTWVLVDSAAMHPVAGTVVGYLLVIPVNFLLQKHFTFRSNAAAATELPRFLFVHAMNILLSAGIMALIVSTLELAPIWGMLATVAVVPIIVFIVLDFWVFYRR
jgi:putative flippase GtrA